MVDLLLAVAAAVLLVGLALALLASLTLAPLVVSLRLAEERRASASRCGALALGSSVVALLGALIVLRAGGLPGPLAVLPLLVAWAVPLVLWRSQVVVRLAAGRAGRHE